MFLPRAVLSPSKPQKSISIHSCTCQGLAGKADQMYPALQMKGKKCMEMGGCASHTAAKQGGAIQWTSGAKNNGRLINSD